MRVKVIGEYGYEQALLGLGLSYGLTEEMTLEEFVYYQQMFKRMIDVSFKLLYKGSPHNKFLRQMIVFIDIEAPRYFHQQLDTYQFVAKQSGSTMHTLLKRNLTSKDFERFVPSVVLDYVNQFVQEKEFELAKSILPESFLQRRIMCTNYQTLCRIIKQRSKHRLGEWKYFCRIVLEQLQYPKYLKPL